MTIAQEPSHQTPLEPIKTIRSSTATYTENAIIADFAYNTTSVSKTPAGYACTPKTTNYTFSTSTAVPRLGVMLVGWGGNNGSTFTAGILANKNNLSWDTRRGPQSANYYGSLVMSSTFRLGSLDTNPTESISASMHEMLPLVNPNDIHIGGWDISAMSLANAMDRAKVLEPGLKALVRKEMSGMVPLPSIYYPDFIAANQQERADNILPGNDKSLHLEIIRKDIRDFKEKNCLDKVIVLWTANTERFTSVEKGVNDTTDALMRSIRNNASEVSPSTIFAVASILEGCPFINGSPQNTFVPGVIELAQQRNVAIGGDDFKSGQTKLKSALVDFLVNAGIKPLAITSYNHLGNNDGCNLSAPSQFRSKEISKSNVVDDMVEANKALYGKGEYPDHTVVIKYVPSVGDSKRAMDEYENEIFLGGRNTMVIHNTCEDSLLACPLMVDLVLMMELFTRVTYKTDNDDFKPLHSVMSILSYMLKAPVVPNGTPVINSLFNQRKGIENVLRAMIGLPNFDDALFEFKAC